jgi:hypothetical protein
MTALAGSKEKAPQERLKVWRHHREGRFPRPCRKSDALLAPESQSFLRNLLLGDTAEHGRARKLGTHASAIPNCTKPSSNGQQLLILPATGVRAQEKLHMYNTIICAIVVVMLASTAVVAKPPSNHTNGQTRDNGQTREKYCRQLVGPEKGEGESGKSGTMRSQIMRWDDCMMQRSPNP